MQCRCVAMTSRISNVVHSPKVLVLLVALPQKCRVASNHNRMHIMLPCLLYILLGPVCSVLQTRLTAIASQHAQDFLEAHSTSSGAKSAAAGKEGRKESEGPTSVLGG
jgi:hypothetical protein